MVTIEKVLELAASGDMAAFSREVKSVQGVVEDLCKLGHSEKIINAVKACLDKTITAKFDTLAQ